MSSPSIHHYVLQAKFPMPQEKLLNAFLLFIAIDGAIFGAVAFGVGSPFWGVFLIVLGFGLYFGIKYILKKMRNMRVIIGADRNIIVDPGFGGARTHAVDSLSAIVIRQKRVRKVSLTMISFIRASDQKFVDEVPLPRFAQDDVHLFFETLKKHFPHLSSSLPAQNP